MLNYLIYIGHSNVFQLIRCSNTGTFTKDAIEEAIRDDTPPIDLIDGEQLVQRLKELGLGVKITMIESVEVNEDWFARI
ncbi:hypothetical protein NDI45_14225 [Leptolyngbya sp. GB1-A1]